MEIALLLTVRFFLNFNHFSVVLLTTYIKVDTARSVGENGVETTVTGSPYISRRK